MILQQLQGLSPPEHAQVCGDPRILGHKVLLLGVVVSEVYDLAFFILEFQQPSFDPGANVVEISLEGCWQDL